MVEGSQLFVFLIALFAVEMVSFAMPPLKFTLSRRASESQQGQLALALSKAECELKQLAGALSEAAIVATTDLRGRIIEVNENFCRISGYEREELLGQDHRILNSGAHSKEFFAVLWATLRAGKVWSGEIQNRRKDGELYWVHSVITPMTDENGKVNRYLAIRFDITEKKLNEMKLLHSSKMASLGEMAGGVAHEINNPLAVISGRAEILLRNFSQGKIDLDKMREDIRKIKSMTDRISKIVFGLRTFSRDSAAESKKSVDLNQIFEETVDLCRENLKNKGIELRIITKDSLMIECSPIQFSQVLLNLLNNSMDAVANLPEKWIEVETEVQAGRLSISITDSGSGIPDEIAQKIMQPFFTTKDIGKGTGLGLSISKGLIESHGGRLYYDPKSVNTRFVIEMPYEEKQILLAA